MKKPELTDVGWLGPRDEMDRASHRFGKCSECHEIICVEKVVTDTQNTQPETNEMLYKAFRTHTKLKHGPNARACGCSIGRNFVGPLCPNTPFFIFLLSSSIHYRIPRVRSSSICSLLVFRRRPTRLRPRLRLTVCSHCNVWLAGDRTGIREPAMIFSEGNQWQS